MDHNLLYKVIHLENRCDLTDQNVQNLKDDIQELKEAIEKIKQICNYG